MPLASKRLSTEVFRGKGLQVIIAILWAAMYTVNYAVHDINVVGSRQPWERGCVIALEFLTMRVAAVAACGSCQ